MWKAKGFKWAIAVLVILTLLMGTGCFNKAPTITNLTASATSVPRGGSSTLNCTATDPDGDVLTYTWALTGGTISGAGNTVTWLAPTNTGTYTITVSVSDGNASPVSDSCNIQVINAPPVITSLTPSATNVAPEASCNISCVASDADGDTLTYDWEATEGTITGTGNSVSWAAPAAEGTYTITVTVSDGQGGTTSESCDITVEMKYGAIDIQSDPDGAEVFIDGVDTGNITPYVITNLAPGSYTVRLEYYHYKYREQTILVKPNETTYLNWSLTYAELQTLTIQPNAVIGKDTYVYDTDPTANWGDLERVAAGTGTGYLVRAYLEFNLDLLPENAVITGAKVGLVYWYTVTSAIAPIGIYAVTEAWTEAGVTWNNQPDFATTPETIVNVPAGVTDGFIYWYINDLARGWWDGSIPNYGVALMDPDESTAEAWKRFYSSDWSTASQRPVLVIYYFDPTS